MESWLCKANVLKYRLVKTFYYVYLFDKYINMFNQLSSSSKTMQVQYFLSTRSNFRVESHLQFYSNKSALWKQILNLQILFYLFFKFSQNSHLGLAPFLNSPTQFQNSSNSMRSIKQATTYSHLLIAHKQSPVARLPSYQSQAADDDDDTQHAILPLAPIVSWSSSSSLSCALRCCAPLPAAAEGALAAFCGLSARGGAASASSSSPSRPPFATPSGERSGSSSLAPSSPYCCILLPTRDGATDWNIWGCSFLGGLRGRCVGFSSNEGICIPKFQGMK